MLNITIAQLQLTVGYSAATFGSCALNGIRAVSFQFLFIYRKHFYCFVNRNIFTHPEITKPIKYF